MKSTAKIIACGASALCAAVLGLQAQSSTSSSSSTDPQQSTSSSTSSPSSSVSGSGSQRYDSSMQSGVSNSNRQQDPTTSQRSNPTRNDTIGQPRSSSDTTSSTDRNASGSIGNSTSSANSSQSYGAQTGSQTSTTISTQTDTEVRDVVQQIDAQGPVVVERITTRFADAACTQENARALVEALHNGGSVTLRGRDGQTATFTVNDRLSYGDAYIAMALAVEALHNAGISGCATPQQWQTVLLGGQLSSSTTASTSTTGERFPGILVLHTQHQNWSQVAQTTHSEITQIVGGAQSALDINMPTGDVTRHSGYRDTYYDNSSRSQKQGEKQNGNEHDHNQSQDQTHWNNSGKSPRTESPESSSDMNSNGSSSSSSDRSSNTTQPKTTP